MDWKPPDFEEIKMDAEIGSYQEDYEPLPVQRPLGAGSPREGTHAVAATRSVAARSAVRSRSYAETQIRLPS